MKLKGIHLLAAMTLAAVALAAPATAQAHCLTESGDECVAAGKGVTFTSTNFVIHTALGTVTCAKMTWHYTVETNNDEHISLEPTILTNNAVPASCVLHTGGGAGVTHTVHISPAGTDTVTYNTWGTASGASRYTIKVTFNGGGSVTCTYTGAVHQQSTNSTSNLAYGPSTMAGGLCGNGTLEGTETVETPDGTPLVADIEPT
jgi:hypothetical protein